MKTSRYLAVAAALAIVLAMSLSCGRQAPATLSPTAPQPAAGLDELLKNVQWLGHASFRLTGEKVVYIDPYQLKTTQPADIILITHGHGDHCSPGDVSKIRGANTVIVTTGDCAPKLGGEVKVIKAGDKITVQGVSIEAIPAYNIGKTNHPKEAGGVGYIVTLNGVRIYHAGDSDHTPEMDAVRADVALLPAGGQYTMDAREAAEAANAIKPQVAIPMHWGSVVGTRADAEQFAQLCKVPARILERQED
jgi:L-ascorbate metabolism protein UlaG (beta-lactamase superfamily)